MKKDKLRGMGNTKRGTEGENGVNQIRKAGQNFHLKEKPID